MRFKFDAGGFHVMMQGVMANKTGGQG